MEAETLESQALIVETRWNYIHNVHPNATPPLGPVSVFIFWILRVKLPVCRNFFSPQVLMPQGPSNIWFSPRTDSDVTP